jgi:PAS domain S-box-containing protein
MVQSISELAIFMLDPEGRIKTWNPGAERMRGWTEAEILETHFSVFDSPEDVAAGQPERHLQAA